MSTRQEWNYAPSYQQQQAAMAALEARRMEEMRLRAERCASIHREVLSIGAAHERLTRELVAGHAANVAQIQADLARLTERARAAGVRLDALGEQLQTSRRELEKSRNELETQIGRLTAMERTAGTLEAGLRTDIATASHALADVSRVAAATVETAHTLGDATVDGRQFAERQHELDARIGALESEIRFVTQRADLAPVAMLTLQAMEENGYRLRDTTTREGLVVYFQKEGEAHQLAVRMAPAAPEHDARAERWDLLAETFDVSTPECLEVMEDFETALESRGALRRRGGRVHPRDDRQALVPQPVRRGRGTSAAERTADLRKA